jgi:MscS family membrane protein
VLVSSINGLPHAVALGIVLLVALLLRIVWDRLFMRGQEPGAVGKWLAAYTRTPVFLFILAVGVDVIFSRLAELPEIRRLPFIPYLGGMIYVFMVLSMTWLAYGLVKGITRWYLARFAPKTGGTLDNELIPAFELLLKVLLIFVAVTVVLSHYHVDLKALLGAAGLASLVLALAAQDTISNMIGGFAIMVDRPFRLGDRIELTNGRMGDVQEIGLRSTKILSPDNNLYIVPNSEIAKSSVINHSYPDERVQVKQKLTVSYGTDIARVKDILLEACRSHPLVLSQPPPAALLAELGDAALHLHLIFWIGDFRTRGRVLDDIQTAVYERFEREGIKTSSPKEVLIAGSTADLPRVASSEGYLPTTR